MSYITESFKKAATDQAEKVSKLEAFQSLVKHKMKFLIAGGVIFVSTATGISLYNNHIKENLKESDSIAGKLNEIYLGSSEVEEKELAILKVREKEARIEIEGLKIKDKVSYSLGGKDSDFFDNELTSKVGKIKYNIHKAVESEKESLKYLKERNLLKTESVEEIKEFNLKTDSFQNLVKKYNFNLNDLGFEKKWVGTAGFSSVKVEQLSKEIKSFSNEIDVKLEKLKSDLVEKSKTIDSSILNQRAKGMHDDVYKNLKSGYQNDLNSQIEKYKSSIKESARSAFTKEGASMSENDWRTIESDLEKDPEWIEAINGLTKVYANQALEAASISMNAINEEKLAAEEKLSQIKSNGNTNGLSTIDMLLLYYWMSGNSSSYSSYTPHSYSKLYNSGSSLTGSPAIGLTSSSAKNVISGGSWSPEINKTTPSSVKAGKIVYNSTTNKIPDFAHSDIRKYAQKQASNASESARLAATAKAYNKAHDKLVAEANEKAQREATNKARSVAESKASQSAANSAKIASEKASYKAAEKASQKAAKVAAEKAAVKASQKAAASASQKASTQASPRSIYKASTGSSSSSRSYSSSSRR